jgi:hypothetical protein
MANELYVTADIVAAQLGQTDTSREAFVAGACEAASRLIDDYCGRTFAKTLTDTSRVYRPDTCSVVYIDDCHSITTVKTDDTDSGTYGTTWAATDYVTEPLNGLGRNGLIVWPATRLVAVATRTFPDISRRPSVQVTGKFGWSQIPESVVSAALIMAINIYRSPDAPFGTAGIADIGLTRVRMPQTVKELLEGFRIPPLVR